MTQPLNYTAVVNAISGYSPITYNVSILAAELAFQGVTSTGVNFYIGPLNVGTSTFPTPTDAYNYFVGLYGSGITNAVNSYLGATIYHDGVYIPVNQNVYEGLEAKQPLSANLTSIAGIAGGISSDMLGLLAADNVPAVKTAMALTAADISDFAASTDSRITGKVDKVTGYALSKNDLTDVLKAKLDGLSTTRTTSALTLSLVGTGATGTQISSTKDSTVRVSYSTQVTVTLGGSPVSQVSLKACNTNSATEGDWAEVGRTSSTQPTTLTVTVGGVYGSTGQIVADIPAGWYVKAVNTGSGTHSEAFVVGQKTIYG